MLIKCKSVQGSAVLKLIYLHDAAVKTGKQLQIIINCSDTVFHF